MSDTLVHLPCNVSQVSDGYHTFEELYEHRNILFVAFLRAQEENIGWRSSFHEDGTMFPGWFIAGLSLSTGMITYHLPVECWSLLDGKVQTYERAPAWDGHAPADVLKRLRLNFLGQLSGGA